MVHSDTSHVSLPCGDWPEQSQSDNVLADFDTGRVNIDPPMMFADWPVAGNLTFFKLDSFVNSNRDTGKAS